MKGTFCYKANIWGVSRYFKASKKQIHDLEARLSAHSDFSAVQELPDHSPADPNENLNRGFSRKNDISDRSRREIITRVRIMAMLANEKTYKTKSGSLYKFRIQMITLTFTAHVSDRDSKRLLNTWLTSMRKTYGMTNYVWRAELTKKNRIHFHIVTDCDLTLDITHTTWNRILHRAGFPGAGKTNSTDVKRFNNAFTYIAKYAGKKEKNSQNDQILTSRLWGSSQNLSSKIFSEKMQEIAEFLWIYLNRKYLNVSHRITDYAECIFFPFEKLLQERAFQYHAGEWFRNAWHDYNSFPETCTWYDPRIEDFFKVKKDIRTKPIIPKLAKKMRTANYFTDG